MNINYPLGATFSYGPQVLVEGETVAAGQTSDAVFISRNHKGPLVTIDPTAATSGVIQYTQAGKAAVAGDTALWYDWPEGSVSALTQQAFEEGITFLRCSAVGGNVVWSVTQA